MSGHCTNLKAAKHTFEGAAMWYSQTQHPRCYIQCCAHAVDIVIQLRARSLKAKNGLAIFPYYNKLQVQFQELTRKNERRLQKGTGSFAKCLEYLGK